MDHKIHREKKEFPDNRKKIIFEHIYPVTFSVRYHVLNAKYQQDQISTIQQGSASKSAVEESGDLRRKIHFSITIRDVY